MDLMIKRKILINVEKIVMNENINYGHFNNTGLNIN